MLGSRRWLLGLAAMCLPSAPLVSGAVVMLDVLPDRASTLYSADSRQDCSTFFATEDAALPLNVVRLRARVEPPVEGVSFQWSLPMPDRGFLLADDDLGPNERASAVRGFCADFGNACILTKSGLRFYDKDTVLWAAPTCTALPSKTNTVFDGGTVKIKVKARRGRSKLGKATATIRWGDPDVASVTAWLIIDGVPRDGIGRAFVPGGGELTPATATVAPVGLPGLPPIKGFTFEAETRASPATCPEDPADACVILESKTAGRTSLGVEVELEDGSALCDNVNFRVDSCIGKPKLTILRTPKKSGYPSGEEVRLIARLRNASPRGNGCALNLRGADVLTCESVFKVGSTEETVTTQWDLQHCSRSTSRPCTTDADCDCATCEVDERCLTESHCSETLDQLCTVDADCERPLCEICKDDETCIRVLDTPAIIVPVGESIDLLDEQVVPVNEIRGKVKVKETWTVNTSAQGSDDTSFSYTVKRPR